MTAPESLQTMRLMLRTPRLADALTLFGSYVQDEHVTRYLTWQAHQTVADSQEIIERFLEKWDAASEFCWFFSHARTTSLSARSRHVSKSRRSISGMFWRGR